MKKKLFAKVVSLVLTMCFILAGSNPISSYAMEDDIMQLEVSENAEVSTRSVGQKNLEYGKDVEFKHNFDFRNYTRNIPAVKMPNDPRIHRVLLKFWFRKDKNDNGLGDVQLTVSLIRNGVVDGCAGPFRTTETETAGGYTEVVVEFDVSMNETVAFELDASSYSTSNGNYRSIDIYRSWVYTD